MQIDLKFAELLASQKSSILTFPELKELKKISKENSKPPELVSQLLFK